MGLNKLEYEKRELKKALALEKEINSNMRIMIKGLNQEFRDYKKEVKIAIAKLIKTQKNDAQTNTTG